MQELVKNLVIWFVNVILGGFLGMFVKFSYTMMHGETQAVLGIVLFLLSIGIGILYIFLLKKLITKSEAETIIPTICLLIGVWIGWANYIIA